MNENITLDYIETHNFKYTGMEEFGKRERVSARFANGARLPMRDEEKRIELRIALSDIVLAKTENYAQAHAKTGINEETLRSYLRRSCKRSIKRLFVAQIVIGLSVDRKEAERLFLLQGAALDPENILLDAIVVNCMENHHDIGIFWEMCDEYGVLSKK